MATAERLLASLQTDGARLRAACLASPAANVAACPDWDNTALLQHMGDVYNFMAGQIAGSGEEMASGLSGDRDAATAWFDQGFAAVVERLSATDPDSPAWTWGADKTKRFYFRRMASETAVHRWDAQTAAASASVDSIDTDPVDADPIDADTALDGIDEVIEVGMQTTMSGPNTDFPAGSLHLHRTDGEGEWMLSAADGVLTCTHEHAKGDAALRGAASDLYLFLWGRDTGNYQLFGDESVARAWSEVAP